MTPYRLRPIAAWTDPVTVDRKYSLFKAGWSDTIRLLCDEVDFLGGEGPVIIQADLQEKDLRIDGGLRANAAVGDFPGVIVSFASQFGPLRYATDTYIAGANRTMRSWQHNVRAIALSLNALRAVDRYGVTRRGEQYAGFTAIEPAQATTFADVFAAADWMRKYAALNLDMTKGMPTGSGPGQRQPTGWAELYRRMAKVMHPDYGGPRADWDRLDEAKRLIDKAGWS